MHHSTPLTHHHHKPPFHSTILKPELVRPEALSATHQTPQMVHVNTANQDMLPSGELNSRVQELNGRVTDLNNRVGDPNNRVPSPTRLLQKALTSAGISSDGQKPQDLSSRFRPYENASSFTPVTASNNYQLQKTSMNNGSHPSFLNYVDIKEEIPYKVDTHPKTDFIGVTQSIQQVKSESDSPAKAWESNKINDRIPATTVFRSDGNKESEVYQWNQLVPLITAPIAGKDMVLKVEDSRTPSMVVNGASPKKAPTISIFGEQVVGKLIFHLK